MAEEEEYYVNVREPAELRRNLLETSRQVVLSLQKYEHFKVSRKREELDNLKRTLREINELIGRLKKEMPAKKTKALPQIPERKIVSVSKSKKPEITSIEKDLAEIERKLSGIR